MKIAYRLMLLALMTLSSLPAWAALTASVDRDTLASGETLQLKLQRDGRSDNQPDLGPLKKDFDVLGTSRGTNMQIINGNMSSQTEVTVLLAPRHDGQLLIPPLSWDGEQSAAITITAGGAGSASSQQAQAGNNTGHVFLDSSLSERKPYVQAAVVLTVRVYADQSLLQASLDLPASNDVLVKQLGKDVQSNEMRNGRNYQVISRQYLLFPQHSGKIMLDGPVLNAQIQQIDNTDPLNSIFGQMPLAGMLGGARPLRLHGKSIALDVLPRPVSATSTNWLPAQNVALQERWHSADKVLHAGEPITRHLHLAATGLTGGQLPDLSNIMQLPDGIKAYPDQASINDTPLQNTVQGSRDQDIALMAAQPGRYQLPPLRLEWWDTRLNAKRVAELPARTLQILPAVGSSSSAASAVVAGKSAAAPQQSLPVTEVSNVLAPAQHNDNFWKRVSLALAVLWLATMLAWWLTARRAKWTKPREQDKPQKKISGSGALNAFRQACAVNDAQAARQHLLAWAGTRWPDDVPQGLNELARRLEEVGVALELRRLDRACYTGDAWNGAELSRAISGLPTSVADKKYRHELPGLYS